MPNYNETLVTQDGFAVDKNPVWLGNNSTPCTLALWDKATGELRKAERPPGEYTLHAVLHRDALEQFSEDLSASASALGMGSTMPGAEFDGFTIHVSDSVPPGDTTGWTNIVGIVPVDGHREHPEKAITQLWVVEGTPGVLTMAVGVTFITRAASGSTEG